MATGTRSWKAFSTRRIGRGHDLCAWTGTVLNVARVRSVRSVYLQGVPGSLCWCIRHRSTGKKVWDDSDHSTRELPIPGIAHPLTSVSPKRLESRVRNERRSLGSERALP